MPLVRISLRQGTSAEYRKALSDGVHRAMIEAIAISPDDRFQVITEYLPEALIYDPQYLGVHRSDHVVFVQITMSFGRKPPQKRKLFKRMAEILAQAPGLPPQDLFINLVETSWENWSFGNGEAQYMDS
jgi:phenylpyruvate tautomerase PptA (4-oxalocrotonate tautomerase family)